MPHFSILVRYCLPVLYLAGPNGARRCAAPSGWRTRLEKCGEAAVEHLYIKPYKWTKVHLSHSSYTITCHSGIMATISWMSPDYPVDTYNSPPRNVASADRMDFGPPFNQSIMKLLARIQPRKFSS